MTPEEAIEHLLRANADVQAAVGSGVAARIYPLVIPQSAGTPGRPKYPAIRYTRVDGPRAHNLLGPSGYASPRIQIDCWALKYKDAKRLANKARVAIDGFKGVVGTDPDTIDINGIVVLDDRDGYDEGEQVYSCSLDVMVMHNE